MDPNKLEKSADKTENVEFYQEILQHHKTTGKTNEVNDSTEQSPESNHAPDTDFRISSVANMTTDSSLDKPLPSISRPKTRSQLRMEQKVAEEKKSALEKEKNDSVDVNSESQKTDEIQVLNRNEQKETETPPRTSVDDISKSEISDNQIVSNRGEDDKSEISDKVKENNSTTAESGKTIDGNNKSNRKRGRSIQC